MARYGLLSLVLLGVACSLALANAPEKPKPEGCGYIHFTPLKPHDKYNVIAKTLQMINYHDYNSKFGAKARKDCEQCCEKEEPGSWAYMSREANTRVCQCSDSLWNRFIGAEEAKAD